YKPLYAALVVDLDNRINLNVAGNLKGAGGTQTSNSGIGPWEMSIAQVLTAGNEWTNLFNGSGATAGRYGANTSPPPSNVPHVSTPNNSGTNLTAPNSAIQASFHSFYDYDGDGAALNPAPPAGFAFPTAPANYGNGNAAELANHPQLFNPF